jgi:outer membrane protein OmpA-like peptidoglycan-associated protein
MVRSYSIFASRFNLIGAIVTVFTLIQLSHAQEIEPAANVNGTLGLGQAVSAEAMGQGRLTLSARGNLYQQAKDFPGAPAKNAQVTTTTAAVAFGLSPYIDAYANLAAYNLSNSKNDNGAGLGTVSGGLQGSIPFSEKIPGRAGFQLSVLAGTSGKQINTNFPDGYNYFETRDGTDIIFKLTQSVVFRGMGMSLRLHLNEGLVSSLQENHSALLLQTAALEFSPAPSFILGTEFHSRTVLKEARDSDPMWFTPSLIFRSENHMSVQIGAEMSLSQERPENALDRALEPWRLFGALTWSLDLDAGKRKEALEKARLDSLSRLGLQDQLRRTQELAESMARKAHDDSLARAMEQDAANRRADSLAAKAKLDSLALAEAQSNLDKERSHRTVWEKEFLKTGVLNMEALYFETGKAEISINSKPYLNLVGGMLSKYPKLQMEIGGHTDNVGSAQKNQILSQDRADAVRLYLTAAYPDLNGRLSARGYGPSQPKSSNTTAQGRQINRRVEILVLNKEVLREYE